MEGGMPKWQRTRRQTIRINHPMSMFTDTHRIGCHRSREVMQQDESALIEDTGFNINYDQSLIN